MEDQKKIKKDDEKMDNRIKKELLSLVKIFVVCLISVYLITNFIAKPIRIEGESMYPTLQDEELGLTNVFAAKFQKLKRFDVVIVNIPDRDEYWVKRIIGMPGDTVSAEDDQVMVNGKPIKEPYLNKKYVKGMRNNLGVFTEDFQPVKLGKGEFFLMGDNRPRSIDSRYYGPFKKDQIIGRSVTILYPFDKMKIVKNDF